MLPFMMYTTKDLRVGQKGWLKKFYGEEEL
jgi:hypothetical protein